MPAPRLVPATTKLCRGRNFCYVDVRRDVCPQSESFPCLSSPAVMLTTPNLFKYKLPRLCSRAWRQRILAHLEPKVDEVDVKYAAAAALVREWNLVIEQTIMARHLVVGMTTNEAARRQQVLKHLKPRIGKE